MLYCSSKLSVYCNVRKRAMHERMRSSCQASRPPAYTSDLRRPHNTCALPRGSLMMPHARIGRRGVRWAQVQRRRGHVPLGGQVRAGGADQQGVPRLAAHHVLRDQPVRQCAPCLAEPVSRWQRGCSECIVWAAACSWAGSGAALADSAARARLSSTCVRFSGSAARLCCLLQAPTRRCM